MLVRHEGQDGARLHASDLVSAIWVPGRSPGNLVAGLLQVNRQKEQPDRAGSTLARALREANRFLRGAQNHHTRMSGEIGAHPDDRESRLAGQIKQRCRLACPELEQGRPAGRQPPTQIRE